MLNSAEIERELRLLGLRLSKDNERIHEFCIESLVVYVKTPGKDSKSGLVEKSPLIIHPQHKSDRALLDTIPGIQIHWSERRKNSNMNQFPLVPDAKKRDDFYGHDVDIFDGPALKQLITVLLGGQPVIDKPAKKPAESSHTDSPPMTPDTIREAIVDARVGQGLFRKCLLDYWQSCALTGITTPELLRASHIKPWRDSNNAERLDLYNGLLLSASVDALFDSGLISFSDSGVVIISPLLPDYDRHAVGISTYMQLKAIDPRHLPYLDYHRNEIFRK